MHREGMKIHDADDYVDLSDKLNVFRIARHPTIFPETL